MMIELGLATFQSTPSGGKATSRSRAGWGLGAVSIHAFRGEGDRAQRREMLRHALFQSTPSGGKATALAAAAQLDLAFQSTPSGGKATSRGDLWEYEIVRFNPRLPGGRRPAVTTLALLLL